jgi:hypothetical protein
MTTKLRTEIKKAITEAARDIWSISPMGILAIHDIIVRHLSIVLAKAEAQGQAEAYEWCADYIQGDVYSVSFHTTFTERAAEARKRAGERVRRKS